MTEEKEKQSSAVVKAPPVPTMTEEAFDQIVQSGDISRLNQSERSVYIWRFAEKLGLNPLTKPIDLIVLNGKLTLYANRTATDQLAKNHQLSISIVEEKEDKDREVYYVKVKVHDGSGREETNIGSVGISDLTGEAYANAQMKAFTKAKRRAVLAFTGLGFLDELEIESIRQTRPNAVTSVPPPQPGAAPTPVVVAAPENPAPQIQASATPGSPKPPSKPPVD